MVINTLVQLISATPVYPHWLEVRKLRQLTDQIAQQLHGEVIEVGAGDGAFKKTALATNPRIKSYLATDFTSWDQEFAEGDRIAESKSPIDVLYGRTKRAPLDARCSALDLPYPENSFDCHVSVEVLEHIPDPEKYFKEAARVTKPGGFIMLTAPFLFRIHPDEQSDFFRILPGGYAALAQRNSLDVVKVAANTGVGTSTSYLIVQWVLRVFLESRLGPLKWLFLPILPVIFFAANCAGFLVDLINLDRRFATRYLVILKKRA